jgi:hypothetical protein
MRNESHSTNDIPEHTQHNKVLTALMTVLPGCGVFQRHSCGEYIIELFNSVADGGERDNDIVIPGSIYQQLSKMG